MFTHIFLIENKIIHRQHFISLFDYIEDISESFFKDVALNGSIDILYVSGEKATLRSNNKDELCQFIYQLPDTNPQQIVMHFNIGDDFKIIHSLDCSSKMYQSKNNYLEVSSTNSKATESFKATFEKHLSDLTPKITVLNKIGFLTKVIVAVELIFLAIIGFGLLLERLNINSFVTFHWFANNFPIVLIIFIGAIILLNLTFNVIFHLIIPKSVTFAFIAKKDG